MFGVLIGELEHHGADEDLAAGVCFPFTDGEARADAAGTGVEFGFPCVASSACSFSCSRFNFSNSSSSVSLMAAHGSIAAFNEL